MTATLTPTGPRLAADPDTVDLPGVLVHIALLDTWDGERFIAVAIDPDDGDDEPGELWLTPDQARALADALDHAAHAARAR